MKEIFHRTSIRRYMDTPVEAAKVEKMLRAAMAAPSAGNQQPWEFYVVTNKEVLAQLAASSPYAGCTAAAPMAFVACYQNNCAMPEYAEIDISAAVENLLLEADSLELGGVWLGIAPLKERMDAVKEILALPDYLSAFAIIPCGYPVNVGPQQNRYEETRVHYVK